MRSHSAEFTDIAIVLTLVYMYDNVKNPSLQEQ